jgi:hypothetical protein
VGRVQSMRDGLGAKPFKFRPLDKDDAVPRVRKAVRGRCEGGPVGTTYNRPMTLTRPDVMRGPRFTLTGPVQASFVVLNAGQPSLCRFGYSLNRSTVARDVRSVLDALDLQ